MKIISNYLDLNIFEKLQNLVFSSTFPFYYNNKTVDRDNDFMFTHGLFDNNKQNSDFFNLITMPLLGKLNLNYLIRAKLNCYTKKTEHTYTKLHVDFDQPHKVALFSFNTCNGFTYFEDTKEKIKSVENQMILFDGRRKHCSVSQTDTNLRVNININYN